MSDDQNDQNRTQSADFGDMPTPQIEEREPNPGGVDALPEEPDNLSADLDPADNPALQEGSPEPVKEAVSGSEDTATEATQSADDSSAADEQPE
jgi:hypothetical protein